MAVFHTETGLGEICFLIGSEENFLKRKGEM
jgi:hypothetical protein